MSDKSETNSGSEIQMRLIAQSTVNGNPGKWFWWADVPADEAESLAWEWTGREKHFEFRVKEKGKRERT